jgi:outer membrane protein TolC
MKVLSLVFSAFLLLPVAAYAGQAREVSAAQPLPSIPFTLDELHSRIDRAHPLLRGAGAEKTIARGKILRALGAFDPNLVNDTELERFVPGADPNRSTQTVGFNDTLVQALHPWGFRGSVGYRRSIGDAVIPDLAFGGQNNQLLLGGFLPLLRGLMNNPEQAELQRSELAVPRAEIKIAQTRQDLFLAASYQFWEWVAAAKLLDVQKRALVVAEDRFKQVADRARAGQVAAIDATEAGQEVHRRREVAVAARRQLEQEQFKLSMFLWENGSPTTPPVDRVPDFPQERGMPSSDDVMAHKVRALSERPEVKEIEVEAKINDIDLALAKNNLLPFLNLVAEPARSPEKFVLGLGYRFGAVLSVPLWQRSSRGEVLQAQGQAERLVLAQQFREKQVVVDVDNALSAIERARERVEEATQALRLAKLVEEGEGFRFDVGASTVMFVNFRERNTIDSENQVVRARAEYYKALALYQWAIGAWARNPLAPTSVMYR